MYETQTWTFKYCNSLQNKLNVLTDCQNMCITKMSNNDNAEAYFGTGK